MPFLRTFYKQTGGLLSPEALVGPAYGVGSLAGGAGLSTRTPAPIAYYYDSIGAGSFVQSGIAIMSYWYGSSVFGSGYAYAPIGIAAGTAFASACSKNVMFGVVNSVYSQAQSVNGYGAGSLASVQATAGGYGFWNSGSVTRFLALGPSGSAVATGNLLVTLLLVSAPPYIDTVG